MENQEFYKILMDEYRKLGMAREGVQHDAQQAYHQTTKQSAQHSTTRHGPCYEPLNSFITQAFQPQLL